MSVKILVWGVILTIGLFIAFEIGHSIGYEEGEDSFECVEVPIPPTERRPLRFENNPLREI